MLGRAKTYPWLKPTPRSAYVRSLFEQFLRPSPWRGPGGTGDGTRPRRGGGRLKNWKKESVSISIWNRFRTRFEIGFDLVLTSISTSIWRPFRNNLCPKKNVVYCDGGLLTCEIAFSTNRNRNGRQNEVETDAHPEAPPSSFSIFAAAAGRRRRPQKLN